MLPQQLGHDAVAPKFLTFETAGEDAGERRLGADDEDDAPGGAVEDEDEEEDGEDAAAAVPQRCLDIPRRSRTRKNPPKIESRQCGDFPPPLPPLPQPPTLSNNRGNNRRRQK